MRNPTLRHAAICLAVILMLCGRHVLADEKPASKIDDLLKKRLAVVVQVRRSIWAQLSTRGEFNWLEMRNAMVEVLNARLELAKTAKDRIKVYEDMLKDVAGLEKLCSARRQAGRGTYSAELQAKALSLKLQIDLERTKQGIGQPTAKR